MRLIPNKNNSKVLADGIAKAKQMEERIIFDTLHQLCKEGIDLIREEHPYKNYTFNLEQSLAYAIYKDGGIIEMDWLERDWNVADEDVYGTYRDRGYKRWEESHNNGSSNARAFLEQYTPETRWAVVFVAGAEYAKFIQKKYNSDSVGVLWGAFTLLQAELLPTIQKHGS